ncbi:MAG: hypothetical protein AB7E73_07085 [Burkholderiales bacterium]
MNHPESTEKLTDNLLNRVNLSDVERLRAEAALLRGEYLADLMLDAIHFLRSLPRLFAHRPKAPRQLKSAG